MKIKRDSTFQFTEYSGINELPDNLKLLAHSAKQALATSYSPYSHFAVGAAVKLQNGEVVLGSNQENGAYPSGICAERVALFYAGTAHPKVPVEAIAIAASYKGKPVSEPISPCGSCRQVMMETQNIGKKPFTILMVGEKKVVVVDDVRILLPFSFSDIDSATKP